MEAIHPRHPKTSNSIAVCGVTGVRANAGLSLLSIFTTCMRSWGLVQGPTFNFMLLKQEKGHRTKGGRLMPGEWGGGGSPLHFLRGPTGGAGTHQLA